MKRSKHKLSHYRLVSFHFGSLIPITWYEVLPGDTIQHSISALVRCAPLVTPVMHVMDVRIHCFFVPNRIMWTTGGDGNQGWQSYITGGAAGNDVQTVPTILSASLTGAVGNNAGVSTLGDFLGVPTSGLGANTAVSALPFRAYQMIWNEFYRDEDLDNPVPVSTAGGNDVTTSTVLGAIKWEKDYLTTSRPWAAKSSTPIYNLGFGESGTTNQQVNLVRSAAGVGTAINVSQAGTAGDNVNAQLDINTLRFYMAVQRYQENRARFGSRYTEYLAYLGVRASDQRLQRPEYVGGGRWTQQISEVLQTGGTSTGAQTGVGQMGGHGISAGRVPSYRRFFEEHGILMCVASVRPRAMYSQRVKRALLRGQSITGMFGTRYDYWQKEFENLGQQGVNALEVDAQGGVTNNFGYQDRYDDYRREESSVHGQFRSTLNTWHLSREFAGAPALNTSFVTCVPSSRIFADTTNDNFYMMTNHHIIARRLLRKMPTPRSF